MSELWASMVKRQFGRVLITVSGSGCTAPARAAKRADDDATAGIGENWLYAWPRRAPTGSPGTGQRGRASNIPGQRDRPIAYTRRAARHDGRTRTRPAPGMDPRGVHPGRAAPVAGYLVHETPR